jgi:hypothetical protein
MATDSPRDSSSDQTDAHKVAVRELAKYCQEFSLWREAKRASAALDKPFRVRGPLKPDMKEPVPPTRYPSV